MTIGFDKFSLAVIYAVQLAMNNVFDERTLYSLHPRENMDRLKKAPDVDPEVKERIERMYSAHLVCNIYARPDNRLNFGLEERV